MVGNVIWNLYASQPTIEKSSAKTPTIVTFLFIIKNCQHSWIIAYQPESHCINSFFYILSILVLCRIHIFYTFRTMYQFVKNGQMRGGNSLLSPSEEATIVFWCYSSTNVGRFIRVFLSIGCITLPTGSLNINEREYYKKNKIKIRIKNIAQAEHKIKKKYTQ